MHQDTYTFAELNEALAGAGINNPGDRMREFASDILAEVDDIDLDEPYPEDRCHEIADGAVPVYYHGQDELAADTPEILSMQPELGPANGSAYDGSNTIRNLLVAVLYEIASNIAHQRLQGRQEDA